jgi:hypothetical protein
MSSSCFGCLRNFESNSDRYIGWCFSQLDKKVTAMHWYQWRACRVKLIFLYLWISANHSLWRCYHPGWTPCNHVASCGFSSCSEEFVWIFNINSDFIARVINRMKFGNSKSICFGEYTAQQHANSNHWRWINYAFRSVRSIGPPDGLGTLRIVSDARSDVIANDIHNKDRWGSLTIVVRKNYADKCQTLAARSHFLAGSASVEGFVRILGR